MRGNRGGFGLIKRRTGRRVEGTNRGEGFGLRGRERVEGRTS